MDIMQIKRNSVRQNIGTLTNVEQQGPWAVSPLVRELSCGNWPCSLGGCGGLAGYSTLRDSSVHTRQFSTGVP